jgi:hypothetical protein
MATPPIPEGKCVHCQAPIVDLFAEWTDEYQTSDGKKAIMAGVVVFDCYYCEGPLQLVLPLAVVMPRKPPGDHHVAKRKKSRCEEWLRNQHPGETLSEVVENAGGSLTINGRLTGIIGKREKCIVMERTSE